MYSNNFAFRIWSKTRRDFRLTKIIICKDRERKQVYGYTIENKQTFIYLDRRVLSYGGFREYCKLVFITLGERIREATSGVK